MQLAHLEQKMRSREGGLSLFFVFLSPTSPTSPPAAAFTDYLAPRQQRLKRRASHSSRTQADLHNVCRGTEGHYLVG